MICVRGGGVRAKRDGRSEEASVRSGFDSVVRALQERDSVGGHPLAAAGEASKAQRGRSIPVICRALAVQPWEVLTYSSEDGTGMDRLLARVEEVLKPEAEPERPEWAENMPEDDDE